MDQYAEKAHSMEFLIYPSEYSTPLEDGWGKSYDSEVLLWPGSGPCDTSFVSIIRSPEFPFPSIQRSKEELVIDPQFSFGCIHGGGTMLSSLDVSLESCFGMLLAKTHRL
jgi:hypothetical protein